jgi:SAM-dependent methyltransferase
MHLTAEQNAKRFFENYIYNINETGSILEIGSMIGGFNMRSLAPQTMNYIGVDLEQGNGVDIVLNDQYVLPFEDNTMDYVISSSCFEHSEFFWLNFLEIIRVLKPSGLFYLNAPSNGDFHRFPVDCWRFFPDSGNAMSNWGKRNGYNCGVIENYTSDKETDIWADYVAVFIKDVNEIGKYKNRIVNSFHNYTNGSIYPHNEILNSKKWGD